MLSTAVATTQALLDLIKTLGQDRTVPVESSSSLAREVEGRSSKKGTKTVLGKPPLVLVAPKAQLKPLNKLTNPMVVSPVQLLHAMGKATSSTNTGFAGLSSLWALVRYLSAFAGGAGQLTVSKDARDLAFHQKTLFSEQLGLGLTWLLTEEHYRTLYGQSTVVRIADAERSIKARLLQHPALNRDVLVSRLGGVMPDGIAFTLDSKSPPANLRALESKGCHTSAVKVQPREMLKALADARVQVHSLQVGGTTLDGWMACAVVAESAAKWPGVVHVPKNGVALYALDPPTDSGDAPSGGDEGRAWQRPGGAWSVGDRTSFARTLDDVSRSSLLAYAGFTEEAERLAPRTAPPHEVLDIPGITGAATRPDDRTAGTLYEGTEVEFRLAPDIALRLFFGLDHDVRVALAEGDGVDATRAFRRRRGVTDEAYVPEAASDTDFEQVRSIGSDGTVFDVRVDAPREVLENARRGLPDEPPTASEDQQHD
jgi:hypothetical protein